MKKYLIIGGLCFAIGASTVLYVGLNDDIRNATHALVLQSEKAQELEAKQVDLLLQSGELDLQLKEAETAVRVREAEIQLRALNRREQELVNAESKAAQRKADIEFAKSLVEVGWIVFCFGLLPMLLAGLLLIYLARRFFFAPISYYEDEEIPVYEEKDYE